MAISPNPNGHGRAPLRNAFPTQSQPPLHDYYQPTPSQNETLIELALTTIGVTGVFCLVIALVTIWA